MTVKPKSSNIWEWTYNEQAKTLAVNFRNGTTYTYANVPPLAAANFAKDVSPGKFLHQVIARSYRVINVEKKATDEAPEESLGPVGR